MKRCLFISVLFMLFGNVMAQDITGKWFGKLEAKGIVLRYVFHIEGDSTAYRCLMDMPDQKIFGIHMNRVTLEAGKLTLELKMLTLVYEGNLNEKGEFVGRYKEGDLVLPMILSRTESSSRPQEPREPFPYRVEEVRFDNTRSAVTLAGTLTLPGEGSDFPVVVLINENGPRNRDGEIEGHKPFAVLADHLTREGIGVLRVDDRGTGMSTGNYMESDLDDFASDTEAAVAYLQELGFKQIGLIGHGSGGSIASLVINRIEGISFVVLLAGPGIRGDELIPMQIALILKASGADSESVKRGEEENRLLLRHLAETTDPEAEKKWVSKRLARFYRSNPKLALIGGTEEKYVERQIKRIYVPEFLSIVRHDPAIILRNITCPVLALYGEKDLQVPADINAVAMQKILENSQSKQAIVKVLPGLNHLFQECLTGQPAEYSMIEQTMSPVVLAEVGDWIREVMKMNKK